MVKKNCTCQPGYLQSPTSGICEECKCGPGELLCSFYLTGSRKCTCTEGYAVTIEHGKNNQTCKKCDCGPHTLACILDASENQLCTCKDKHVLESQNGSNDKVCTSCDCGFHSKSCTLTPQGYRKCTCKDEYIVRSEYSWGGDEECETTEDATAWKTATYLLSAACAVVIVGLLISIWRKRSKSR